MEIRQDLDEELVERMVLAFLGEIDVGLDGVDLSDMDMVAASNRDAYVRPTHLFVMCRQVDHRGGGLYAVEVAITLVTQTEDESNERRREMRARVGRRLHVAEAKRRFYEDTTGLTSRGWKVTGPTEISQPGGTATGDVWVMLIGVVR